MICGAAFIFSALTLSWRSAVGERQLREAVRLGEEQFEQPKALRDKGFLSGDGHKNVAYTTGTRRAI